MVMTRSARIGLIALYSIAFATLLGSPTPSQGVPAQSKTAAADRDHSFVLALRELAVKSSVKLIRIEAEQTKEKTGSITKSSWRVAASGEGASLIEWTNRTHARFQSCSLGNIQFIRAGAHVKDFDAALIWICFSAETNP
jgi:hypothetical protein